MWIRNWNFIGGFVVGFESVFCKGGWNIEEFRDPVVF